MGERPKGRFETLAAPEASTAGAVNGGRRRMKSARPTITTPQKIPTPL